MKSRDEGRVARQAALRENAYMHLDWMLSPEGGDLSQYDVAALMDTWYRSVNRWARRETVMAPLAAERIERLYERVRAMREAYPDATGKELMRRLTGEAGANGTAEAGYPLASRPVRRPGPSLAAGRRGCSTPR